MIDDDFELKYCCNYAMFYEIKNEKFSSEIEKSAVKDLADKIKNDYPGCEIISLEFDWAPSLIDWAPSQSKLHVIDGIKIYTRISYKVFNDKTYLESRWYGCFSKDGKYIEVN